MQVAEGFDETLDAQKGVLENIAPPADAQAFLTTPSNLTPWGLVAFMTDLSVSASGVLGSLTAKGTPAVSLIWRKKETKALANAEALADVSISADTSQSEVDGQFDAAVRAAMATGKVRDESRLRAELGKALSDFGALTSGIEASPVQDWWASRVRLDVIVDATGKIALFGTVGSEVRLRFEWHRIKKAANAPAPTVAASSDPKAEETRRSFNELVGSLASDLSVLSAPGASATQGYQPYLFRVGIGMTAGGTIGLVKSDLTAIGEVYFSRDVPKPSVLKIVNTAELAQAAPVARDGEINLIESSGQPQHLAFARDNRVEAQGGGLDQVVYRVNRAQLRKGLARAEGMAGFFARRASRVRSGHWGLYEIRASFDLSLAGTLGMVTATGLATAEIDLYNEGF